MRKALVLLLAAFALMVGSSTAAFAADTVALDRVAQEEVQEDDDGNGDKGLWGLLGLLGLAGLAGLKRRDRERDVAIRTDTTSGTRRQT